jgi:hypothetical protein
MIRLVILAAAAVATPAPAPASPGAPAPVLTSIPGPVAPADPERLALARTVVDSIWPLGTYEKMTRATMGPMMNAVISSMFDAPDAIPASAVPAAVAPAAQLAATKKNEDDLQESVRNMYRVMMEAMIPLASRIEPGIREALARSTARKFDAGQLRDLNRFFETPTGRVYARESLFLLTDPEVAAQIGKMTPKLMKAMPQVMAGVSRPLAPHPVSGEAAQPSH